MKKNEAYATWQGNLKNGNGQMRLHSVSGVFNYTFSSRFEKDKGTNPEELVAAAHAGCFSMALADIVAKKGYEPEEIKTTANAILSNPGDGYSITDMELYTEAKIRDIDDTAFQSLASEAKQNCPVSRTLSSVNIRLTARLIQ
ncbi:MAG: OsmC family peroxiredoxin [Bacteroidales bacterium]|nr:OsmC family peroxiredoxin [Bacteroidales bacterium]